MASANPSHSVTALNSQPLCLLTIIYCVGFSRQNRKQFCLSFLSLKTGEVCVSMAACEGNEVHLIILKPNPSFPQSKPTKNAISVQQ